jgi:hypothetical protein
MKLCDPFEYKGYWWKPDDPDNKVAGVLTYKPGESITLELIGTFDNENDAVVAFLNKSEESVIHGALGNAKKVTLLKCHPSGSVNLSSFFPIIRYTCIYCFIGRCYSGMDEEGDFRMTVHFPELSYWCHPGVLRETFMKNKEQKGQIISLSFEALFGGKTLADVELDDGYTIQLKAGASLGGGPALLSNEIGQSSWLEISRNEKVSFNQLLSHIYKFEEFLSIATMRVVESSEITIYDEEYYQEYNNGEKHHHGIYFFSSHWKGKDNEKVDTLKFLFGYDDIKDRLGEMMRLWYADKNDMYPVRSNLVDSLEKKRMFSNMDFLILARALDGYCIRSKYKGSFTNRMKTVIEKFSDILHIRKDNIKVEELVDSRDYYAHFMPRKGKKHVLDGFELHDLTQKVRRLVICCVLSDLGLDNTIIDTIFKNSNSKYINN